MQAKTNKKEKNMKLREYLDSKGIKYSAFARRLGVTPPTLQGYMRMGFNPTVTQVLKIQDFTEGEVRFKDWVDSIAKAEAEKNRLPENAEQATIG